MYIKVVFVKKLLDVDIIFNIESAIVDDMYFVLCSQRGIWVSKEALNIGMFLRFISLKCSSQFRITFQKSLTFEHLSKKCTMSSTSLQYSHISKSFIFILYNYLLHGITLWRTLYWKVWIFMFLRTTNGSLKILCHDFSIFHWYFQSLERLHTTY